MNELMNKEELVFDVYEVMDIYESYYLEDFGYYLTKVCPIFCNMNGFSDLLIEHKEDGKRTLTLEFDVLLKGYKTKVFFTIDER